MNPAVVSLKGYANVNRELLTSVIKSDKKYFVSDRFLNVRLFSVNYNNRHLSDRFTAIQIIAYFATTNSEYGNSC